MTPAYFNRVVRRELGKFLREGLLDTKTYDVLQSEYVISRWDWRSLGRWFLVFGAVSCAAGVVILLKDVIEFTLWQLAIALAVLMLPLFGAAHKLKQRKLLWTPRSLELLGGFSLIGLTFTLGAIYSTESGNWPALLLIDLFILLLLTYVLNNVLLLILSAVVFFVWFGGVTGYAFGWGAYWFSMNYPLRFFLVSLLIVGVAIIHWHGERGPLARYREFFKVWLSAGLFFGEMALWLLSLFGNFSLITDVGYKASAGELFLFNILWTGSNMLLLYLGATQSLRILRGYGATFLMIQGYTLYFWHIAEKLGPILGSLLAGASALMLVIYFERKRCVRKEDEVT
jgi:hypothetical protein